MQVVVRAQFRRSERGQALVETAIFAILAVIIALGLLSLIPAHRVRTAATAGAYACAQFLSQSPDPGMAMQNALDVANKTLGSDWSALRGVQFAVVISPPSGPGEPGSCAVSYTFPPLYRIFGAGGTSAETFVSRAETWKAKWR